MKLATKTKIQAKFAKKQNELETKTNKTQLGRKGEQLAKQFLEAKGYTILEENYRHLKGEVDLIAKKENWLVFVEVKLRKNDKFGHPETFVNPTKTRLVHECATHYMNNLPSPFNLRFDIVSITGNLIEHFEDAF